jgi:hypothetical protein
MLGTPLPVQWSPFSSSRAKQPGWCSSETAAFKLFMGNFFDGFRVKMQPQTTSAVIAKTKIAAWVFSVAETTNEPL